MSKRKNESNAIKDLMQSFIKENNLTKGMQKLKIEEAWEKIIARTSQGSICGEVLRSGVR